MWVCLKMLCTPKPNGFADHYPYEKWLFHWEYTLFSDKPISGNCRGNNREIILKWPEITGLVKYENVPGNMKFPKMGYPNTVAGWFMMENPKMKRMIWGTPIVGNLQIWSFIWILSMVWSVHSAFFLLRACELFDSLSMLWLGLMDIL